MYYKNISDGYIACLSTGCGQIPITKEEYDELLAIIRTAPAAPEGFVYMLRDVDLQWDLVELPPDPEPGDEDAGEEDFLQVLDELGVRIE